MLQRGLQKSPQKRANVSGGRSALHLLRGGKPPHLQSIGGMDASLMARMKELEEENRRLRKMYVEEKLKAEIVSEALAKKW